jgi:exodeoxyribonuclease VII small subunit
MLDRLIDEEPRLLASPFFAAQRDEGRQLSFEAALARLEEIVRTLEKGEAPLDQSIELYQEGDRLKRHCEARLKDAQARIEQIAFGSDGKPAGLKPFDAG